jgi:hypothetical protein
LIAAAHASTSPQPLRDEDAAAAVRHQDHARTLLDTAKNKEAIAAQAHQEYEKQYSVVLTNQFKRAVRTTPLSSEAK